MSQSKLMLLLSAAQRIDQICDRFEDDWNAGRPARIEDCLTEVAEPERTALLRELLEVELELLERQGVQRTSSR